MPAADYYWSRPLIKGLGKMWFPLALQEATSTGGGKKLLGSVVEELGGGFLGIPGALGLLDRYPAPYPMTVPQLILQAIETNRQALGISSDLLVLEQDLVLPTNTLKISRKNTLKGGVGPFPSLPATFNLDVDYSRVQEVAVAFGAGTKVLFIPTGHLSQLYAHFNGNSSQVHTGLAINIDENLIVDQIVIAKEFSVTFASSSVFDAEFDAKLDALNSLPAATGKLTVSKRTESSITARIMGESYYLVAFKTIDWDDVG